jgi:hypothetical protein
MARQAGRSTESNQDVFLWHGAAQQGRIAPSVSITCDHFPDFVHWDSLIGTSEFFNDSAQKPVADGVKATITCKVS